MGLTPILVGVGAAVFAGAAFFFALAETALFSLGKWQARQLAQKEPQVGSIVLQLLSEPQELLATMVLGNTFAGAALLATVVLTAVERGWSLASPLAVLLLVLFLGCEVLPKTLAVRRAEKWSMRIARPMLILHSLSRPLRQVALRLNSAILRAAVPGSVKPQTALTDEEYQELLEMAFQQGALAESEKEIILQIIRLDRRTVQEVKKPRSQVACIPDDLSVEEMIAAARRYKHRRLLMYDETPDTIVGVLNTRVLLLNPQGDLADAVEFPSFVPETMNLLQLLKSLQRQQRGLAVVLDEFGGTDGIVTMEDILGEMVGGIRNEGESEGFIMERLGPGKWRVNGTMRLDDFRRECPALGDVPEVETLGGLLVSEAEVVPAPGQSVTYRGLRLTAHVADDRRVRELLVEIVRKKGLV